METNVDRALRRREFDDRRRRAERRWRIERRFWFVGIVMVLMVVTFQTGRTIEACDSINLTLTQCAKLVVSKTPHTDIYRFQDENRARK
jgi:hypothetical protein